jgi:hypothetical protein
MGFVALRQHTVFLMYFREGSRAQEEVSGMARKQKTVYPMRVPVLGA